MPSLFKKTGLSLSQSLFRGMGTLGSNEQDSAMGRRFVCNQPGLNFTDLEDNAPNKATRKSLSVLTSMCATYMVLRIIDFLSELMCPSIWVLRVV
jgi:hypothetical protein